MRKQSTSDTKPSIKNMLLEWHIKIVNNWVQMILQLWMIGSKGSKAKLFFFNPSVKNEGNEWGPRFFLLRFRDTQKSILNHLKYLGKILVIFHPLRNVFEGNFFGRGIQFLPPNPKPSENLDKIRSPASWPFLWLYFPPFKSSNRH